MSIYIALDGPDGGGKSTQAQLLTASLTKRGHDVLHLREPGSTALGERLRELLLDPKTGDIDPLTEALMFSAARREMIETEVRPALEAGRIVISERSFLSTMVYQCLAPEPSRCVALDLLHTVTSGVHGSARFNAIFLLDVEVEISLARISKNRDRFESRGGGFLERVRAAYLDLAKPGRIGTTLLQPDPGVVVLDATRTIETVRTEIHAVVEGLLGD